MRRLGLSIVVELGVVIVFDDPDPPALGPLQQRQAPLEAQRVSQRVMMGRRDVNAPPAPRSLHQLPDVQPLLIDADRPHLQPRRLHQLFRPLVTRLFDEYRIAGIEQHLRAQRQRLLRAGDHDHLLRRRLDAPLPLQIVRDLRTQLRQALRIGIPQQPLAVPPQRLLFPLQPRIDGKRPQISQRGRQRRLTAGVRRMADRQQRPAAIA